MFYIVGLGNPDKEYVKTRHNIGREIAENFSKENNFSDFDLNKKEKYLISKGKIKKSDVEVILPETFMNKSGEALLKKVKTKKAAEKLIVIHDDLDLPLGKIKIVFNRGAGGHRGVESIAKRLKTNEFIRIKIGISMENKKGVAKKPKTEEAVVKFVLGKFKSEEEKEVKKVIKKVLEALTVIVTKDYLVAMNDFN
jgi:peptidyl-tRNA hydrolase, PTH1 family